MTTSLQSSERSYLSEIGNGIYTGGVIMLAQTPLVTSLNRISVVSCYTNSPMEKSIWMIYNGTVDSAPKPSVGYFFRGVSGHLVKESARLGFKSTGLVMKPSLDEHFKKDAHGKFKGDITFAGTLSFGEMAINPTDTILKMWQAGKKIQDLPKGRIIWHLYKGSGANGLRQFGTWLGYPFSERLWSRILGRMTSLDPHSMAGIAVKSLPQSFQITLPVWIFERLKNELQYHPNLVHGKYRYFGAYKHIKYNQGWIGFTRGFIPKVWSNYFLIMGANYLLEQGRLFQNRKA